MSVQLLAFFFGILLLFVAIVGGGFELRELKVPRVGWVTRVVSAVVGAFFLVLGFPGITAPDGPGIPSAQAEAINRAPTTPTAATTATTQAPVDFVIRDELGEGQITEQITVHIDGRMVGTLTVDAVHPSSSLTVTVPKPGAHEYILDSRTTFDDGGQPVEVPGHGSGQIDVRAGASFSVVFEFGTDELLLQLRQ
jgi:hypothetical protein